MSQAIPDLYAVLGVAAEATAEQIRAAFRQASKRRHPDAGGTAEAMIELLEAYEVLSDPGARAEYDAYRRQHAAPAWEATYQRSTERARATYASHGQEWQELMRWMDQRSREIQASPHGRLAAGGLTGLVIGAAAGALVGSYFGIGAWAGVGIGAACGALGGAIHTGTSSQPS